MTIGGGLALIIIGAILTYAVEFDISGVDIRVVGIILMVGGLAGLIIGIARLASARRRPPPAVREEHYYEDAEPGYRHRY
ncbi:DUF6458 family protein [Spirillospora sp. CA-255316]